MHPDDEFLKAMEGDPQVRRLRRGGPERVAARPVVPAPEPASPAGPSAPPSLSARLQRAEADREAAEAERARLQAESLRLAERLTTLESELRSSTAAREAVEAHVAELLAARRTLEDDRRALLTQIGHLHHELTEARAAYERDASATRRVTPVADVLASLALPSPEVRFREALTHIEGTRAEKIIRHLHTAQPDELRHVLSDKVAWVCAGCRATATHDTVIDVAPEDCDLCGGSSIAAAARRFREACRSVGCRRVLIVGGSPRYHAQLIAALQSDALELILVEGNRKISAARARDWCVRAQRGFIWGPTILDHAVSGLFEAPHIHTVPVRGIARFLDEAARRLASPVPPG